ncbi:uncharacterized protein GGS25DRAFT_469904 [Hypoxylon fragiforme]|uniref:uncharacterized protein n=1 Tax=Hypoxylon fragiforme TaxID=63214 RepID=UPI0020C70FA2|nr:uncharacterized protein GGS25DRAFT_469904 [Hypoxylon fragiforme]KAI2613987.1 hypothetical protein GGS25DRAFT_469904 [Hypoxylon fragiforme]
MMIISFLYLSPGLWTGSSVMQNLGKVRWNQLSLSLFVWQREVGSSSTLFDMRGFHVCFFLWAKKSHHSTTSLAWISSLSSSSSSDLSFPPLAFVALGGVAK